MLEKELGSIDKSYNVTAKKDDVKDERAMEEETVKEGFVKEKTEYFSARAV